MPMPKVFENPRKLVDYMRRRRRNYQLTFGSPGGRAVLDDLAEFCRANETTFHADPRVHAALEGRREVWLRIQQHLNLTGEQLAAIYSGRTINPEED